jgi:hypothetical protein
MPPVEGAPLRVWPAFALCRQLLGSMYGLAASRQGPVLGPSTSSYFQSSPHLSPEAQVLEALSGSGGPAPASAPREPSGVAGRGALRGGGRAPRRNRDADKVRPHRAATPFYGCSCREGGLAAGTARVRLSSFGPPRPAAVSVLSRKVRDCALFERQVKELEAELAAKLRLMEVEQQRNAKLKQRSALLEDAVAVRDFQMRIVREGVHAQPPAPSFARRSSSGVDRASGSAVSPDPGGATSASVPSTSKFDRDNSCGAVSSASGASGGGESIASLIQEPGSVQTLFDQELMPPAEVVT